MKQLGHLPVHHLPGQLGVEYKTISAMVNISNYQAFPFLEL